MLTIHTSAGGGGGGGGGAEVVWLCNFTLLQGDSKKYSKIEKL